MGFRWSLCLLGNASILDWIKSVQYTFLLRKRED